MKPGSEIIGAMDGDEAGRHLAQAIGKAVELTGSARTDKRTGGCRLLLRCPSVLRSYRLFVKISLGRHAPRLGGETNS